MAVGGAGGRTRGRRKFAASADIDDQAFAFAGKLERKRACVRSFGIGERRRACDIEEDAKRTRFEALVAGMLGELKSAPLAGRAGQRRIERCGRAF